MKRTSLAGLLLVVAVSLVGAQAQTSPGKNPSPSPDPRTNAIPKPPAPRPNPTAEPEADDSGPTTPQGVVVGTTSDGRPEAAGPAATERHGDPLEAGARILSPPQIQSRIAEAERLLKSRPLQTAKTSPATDLVTLAALDRNTSRIHLITIYKDVFLTKGSDITASSSLGTTVNIRVIRANGVNTAVAAFDAEGRSLVPLVVEFPIEKRGVF
ncbi:MAG TPA: hypothetical protein VGO68_01085, partial [Pyrinomonadaceae bacterium]|nr:hypothetical protein [Pyrinomonadaceae bacterium]